MVGEEVVWGVRVMYWLCEYASANKIQSQLLYPCFYNN